MWWQRCAQMEDNQSALSKMWKHKEDVTKQIEQRETFLAEDTAWANAQAGHSMPSERNCRKFPFPTRVWSCKTEIGERQAWNRKLGITYQEQGSCVKTSVDWFWFLEVHISVWSRAGCICGGKKKNNPCFWRSIKAEYYKTYVCIF